MPNQELHYRLAPQERQAEMNVLPLEKQIQIVSALVEGNSIRSTARMVGVEHKTVMRVLLRVGERCQRLLDGYGEWNHRISVDNRRPAQMTPLPEGRKACLPAGSQVCCQGLDSSAKTMNSGLALLTIGLFLGMRHATDPDHVIAVSTIVSRERSLLNTALIHTPSALVHT